MLTSEFDYNLPQDLIAQVPVEPRDSSKLMVVDRKNKIIKHQVFSEIISYLKADDLLVWNDTKVFKARLKGVIELSAESAPVKSKGGSDIVINMPIVEIFLLRPAENKGVWRAMAKPGKRLRLGMKINFAEDFSAEVIFKDLDGTILLQFEDNDVIVREKANRYGQVPLPPYIKMQVVDDSLNDRYQTVYAKSVGSVAAPTAGFHFTSELIEKIKDIGVEFAEVTLHVGLGTFQPVKTKKITEHKMHSEWVEITDKNAEIINRAKAEGRRVIAIGTTTVRALEAVAIKYQELRAFSGEVNIFIYPGYDFKIIDALITNFHLPKSTLLMLVSAFCGNRKFMLDCYNEAIRHKYRFYSFGDAMMIV